MADNRNDSDYVIRFHDQPREVNIDALVENTEPKQKTTEIN